MKAQINPTIKAHLIRGAVYLLLLVAVCAIPFALAQSRSRGTTKQSAKLTVNTNAAANVYLAQNALPSTGAAQSQLSSVGERGSVAGLPQTSMIPQITTGVLGAHLVVALAAPNAPQVILYDQYNNAGTLVTLSATFTDSPPNNSDLADDFVVPGGQTWNVQSIDADGVYFSGPGPANSFNVFFYTNSGGFPGTQVYSATNQTWTQNGSTFTVNLPTPAVLTAGTYWVEIQANMTFDTGGEWGWTDRMVTSNNAAAWQNPAGGFGICPSWSRRGATCGIDASAPDQVYRLNGTIGGASPTPTPTAIPCNYGFTTGTGAIVPGTTDTGNHCDDCDTLVALPFSFQLYGNTYNSVNVSSNGRLDFVCVNDPGGFVTSCLPATPNLCPFAYTIFPLWHDLQTDVGLSGCSTWTNGCGIFTSVSGSAPNRIFNIEWHAVRFEDNTNTVNFEVRLYENNPNKRFDIIYGASTGITGSDTAGVQGATGFFTQDFCNVAPPQNASRAYTLASCPSPSPTPTTTPVPSPTARPRPSYPPRPTPPPRP